MYDLCVNRFTTKQVIYSNLIPTFPPHPIFCCFFDPSLENSKCAVCMLMFNLQELFHSVCLSIRRNVILLETEQNKSAKLVHCFAFGFSLLFKSLFSTHSYPIPKTKLELNLFRWMFVQLAGMSVQWPVLSSVISTN